MVPIMTRFWVWSLYEPFTKELDSIILPSWNILLFCVWFFIFYIWECFTDASNAEKCISTMMQEKETIPKVAVTLAILSLRKLLSTGRMKVYHTRSGSQKGWTGCLILSEKRCVSVEDSNFIIKAMMGKYEIWFVSNSKTSSVREVE